MLKKNLLLLSVVTCVTTLSSAQAVTIYESKGLKYSLKGDFQIQLRKKVGDDREEDLEFDDLELKNRLAYSLNDKIKAFGQLDFSFDREANRARSDDADGGRLEEAYVGLGFSGFVVRVGKQNYSTDEFSVEKSYETVVEDDVFDLNDDDGDDVIRVDVTYNNIYVSASTDLAAEGNSDSDGNESRDLYISTSVDDVEVAFAYQNYRNSADSDDVDSWGVSVKYNAGFASLAADYGTMEDTADVYNLVAVIPVGRTINTAIGMQSSDEKDDRTVNGWYANITYKFPDQKNVSLFAEIADDDKTGSDFGYLTGIRLVF